ncbi:hypothetical protein F4781DRAFT_398193 [Annulohypoxylon bovei var. microspora]|nr:hypothetical protein F4781DRAFT_398193 [Annulohypoxylon bovei var. microspora]
MDTETPETLRYNVNPLGLYAAHHDASSPLFPKQYMELNAHNFDFFHDIHHLRWPTSASEIAVDERIPRPRGSSSVATTCAISPNSADDNFNDGSTSLGLERTSHSSGWQWQSSMPPPYSPSKKRTYSIPNLDSGLGRDDGRQIRRRQTLPGIDSLPPSPDAEFGMRGGRKRQLQKNRVAASRCRQKKKKETAKLEARERDLAAKRDVLKCVVDDLRVEVLGLKNEVLKHGMCDCSVIQKYITETARQMV